MSRQQAKTMRDKMKTAFDSPFRNNGAKFQEQFTAGKSVISRQQNADLG